jgi:tRNA A-37 threonylcarbamoyl transferase component Bud32
MLRLESYHDLLDQAGLTTIEGVKRYCGEVVKDQRGRRDILRVVGESGGERVVLFLKRMWRPYRKDGVWSLLRRGRVWSMARQEWENMRALQRAGILTAELVAYGEECGVLWEKFSFIITRAAPPSWTVEDLARECRDVGQRRRVVEAMGRQVRKMHEAGLASPDLFARHFFVDEGEHVQFWLIDMARVDHGTVTLRTRARDLAALHVGLAMRWACVRERMRFMRAYGGGRVDRELVRLVRRRAKRLLRREKFGGFGEV